MKGFFLFFCLLLVFSFAEGSKHKTLHASLKQTNFEGLIPFFFPDDPTEKSATNQPAWDAPTAADKALGVCLAAYAAENLSPTETCLDVGIGVTNPPGSARMFAACTVAMYTVWIAVDPTSKPFPGTTSLPIPHLSIAKSNSEETYLQMLLQAVYETIAYILPGSASRTAASILSSYNVDVTSSNLNLAQETARRITQDFIATRLATDNSNQVNCYADPTNERYPNPDIRLDSLETVLESKARLLYNDSWSEPLYFDIIPARRPFVLPHAALITKYAVQSLVPTLWNSTGNQGPNGLVTLDAQQLGAQMMLLPGVQSALIENNGYYKLMVDFFANPPLLTNTAGFYMYVASSYVHLPLDQKIKQLALMGVAEADGGMTTWNWKRLFTSVRPFAWIPLQETYTQLSQQYLGPYCGFGDIQGYQWRPYQAENYWTPPFPENPSGHSTFSFAASRMLELTTGRTRIGAPLNYTYKAGSCQIEPYCSAQGIDFAGKPCTFSVCRLNNSRTSENSFVPPVDITIGTEWQTWEDIAVSAALSRQYGGIHISNGDFNGRFIGRKVADIVYETLCPYVNGPPCDSIYWDSSPSSKIVPGVMLLVFLFALMFFH